MTDEELQARLRDVIQNMLRAEDGSRSIPRPGWPIDVSRPNIHENKKDFLEERDAVVGVLADIKSVIAFLVSGKVHDAETHSEANERVTDYIDSAARTKARDALPDSALKLVRKNAADVGLSTSMFVLLYAYQSHLEMRLADLDDQEKEFWSGAHRPPNHYARTIALRLAREYAHNRGALPTVGVSGDGGHPSTGFTKALEAVFELLGIQANVRNAATWAVGQLTEADTRKTVNALAQLAALYEDVPGSSTKLADFTKKKGPEN